MSGFSKFERPSKERGVLLPGIPILPHGVERHIVPVSELKIISDINSRKQEEQIIDLNKIANLPDPDSKSTVVFQLKRIADSLDTIREILEIKNLR